MSIWHSFEKTCNMPEEYKTISTLGGSINDNWLSLHKKIY